MKQEVFTHILDKLRSNSRRIDELYALDIDLVNFSNDFSEVIDILLKVYYGQEGSDWIDWYLLERDPNGDQHQATDGEGNPLCYDDKSLWEEVEKCRLDNEEQYELPVKLTDEEREELLNMMKNNL